MHKTYLRSERVFHVFSKTSGTPGGCSLKSAGVRVAVGAGIVVGGCGLRVGTLGRVEKCFQVK